MARIVDVEDWHQRLPLSVLSEVYDHISGKLSKLDAQVIQHVPPGGNWRNLPDDFESERIEQIRRSAAAGEGSRSTYYGRLVRDRQSYTISTYFNRPGNGCFIHPDADRLISVREAARLQGFPDAYRFSGRGRSRFVQVGNAVPPLLAFQVASVLGRGCRFVDLFSGAGGLSLGFDWAGHELIAAVDNDRASIETLKKNGVKSSRALLRDLSTRESVSAVIGEIIKLNEGKEIDLIVGGPPCQGFSTAGSNRANDPRNRLVKSFLQAVDALRPRVVLMENVPALAFRGRRSTLSSVLRSLKRLGYAVDLAVLHSEAYGLPQLRRRLFIQARLEGGLRWPAPHRQLLQPAQPALQPAAEAASAEKLPPTVLEALGDLPHGTVDDPDVPVSYAGRPTSPFQQWAREGLGLDDLIPEVASVSLGGTRQLAVHA